MKRKISQKSDKKQHGITLLALVVTVIVLLILASISIGMISGKNGIFKSSSESKSTVEIVSSKQQLLQYLVECKTISKEKVNLDIYLDHLEDNDVRTTINNDISHVEIEGKIFKVTSNDEASEMTVDFEEYGTITAPRIRKIETT